jgi:hypothetical protein
VSQHGCFNRPPTPPTMLAQDGWIEVGLHPNDSPTGRRERVRLPRMVEIPDLMSRDCKHQMLTPNDPKCAGCCWKTTEKAQ